MRQIELTEDMVYTGSLILVTPKLPFRGTAGGKSLAPAIHGQPEILLNGQAAGALQRVLAEIRCKDEIRAVSGFRTRQEQEKIWQDAIAERGRAFAQTFVAAPGHSEHETGLAIDLAENGAEIDFICPRFPRRGICRRFRRAAPRFGFVERYREGKEKITGIGAEPWHFRYVGYPHAVLMARRAMVLEEYIRDLKEKTDAGRPGVCALGNEIMEIFYVSLEGRHSLTISVPENIPYQISGTNEGGVVVSLRRA